MTRLRQRGALSLLLQDSFPVELPTANSDGSEHSRHGTLSASPYLGGAGQIVADLTGKFVHVGDNQNTGQVIGYTRDATTGALTLIGNTTTAIGAAWAIGIIR